MCQGMTIKEVAVATGVHRNIVKEIDFLNGILALGKSHPEKKQPTKLPTDASLPNGACRMRKRCPILWFFLLVTPQSFSKNISLQPAMTPLLIPTAILLLGLYQAVMT